ncbi:MAG: circadian clock protein KaiA [Aphanothece sp. CMT-3BRIN-NPC111]|nr:circadian clock protein KaiA [Aphanothece sp. CMT-3BRIN-NPC111]
MLPQLSICTFVTSEPLAQSVRQFLSSDRYNLAQFSSLREFLDFVEQHKYQLDCLLLEYNRALLPAINQLYEQGTLLPVVIVHGFSEQSSNPSSTFSNDEAPPEKGIDLYHPAEVLLSAAQVSEIAYFIDRAIAEFIKLSPHCALTHPSGSPNPRTEVTNPDFLMQQQRRLAEKLKERLGYLAVYYKRNPQLFFRHLPRAEKQKLLEKLRLEYRQIILNYFTNNSTLNQEIDEFVNSMFFADLSVSQIVEIHMELMEEFSKQLKLEGRSEEFLLDYRLTLIDIIAHLCEMYRRAIPREL